MRSPSERQEKEREQEERSKHRKDKLTSHSGHLGPTLVTTDNRHAAKKADLIIVAVKAGDAKQLLSDISRFTTKKIVISLMAAITIKRLQESLLQPKIVRTMPNIAATIKEAITAYSSGANLTESCRTA